MPIESHIKITRIKSGDTVKIIDSLDIYVSHVSRLNEFIGKTGTVIEVDSDGSDGLSCCLELESDRYWWYPEACLQKVGDKECLPEYSIRPHLNVTIGKTLESLRVSDIYDNTKILQPVTKSIHLGLYGKTGKVVSENFIHKVKQTHNDKMDTYVGVDVDGDVYYLPRCVLFDLSPSYNPKIIKI